MNKIKKYIVAIILVTILSVGCSKPKLEKYKFSFFGTFDTITQVVIYTTSEGEAKKYEEFVKNRYMELNNLFDKYNSYDGLNNIKTINDNAGKAPVKVSKEIIDLLKFSIDSYKNISDETNVAMGSVLKIWSEYRDEHETGSDFIEPGKEYEEKENENAQIPPMEELKIAAEHININDVLIDEKDSTVYLKDPLMSLDVGAVAKGFATELVCNELKEMGINSALISSGGNVKVIGEPPEEDRSKFAIGLQNPDVLYDEGTGDNLKDIVYTKDATVVTSGDYQRFYIVNGKRYHHLIDKDTLMPGEYFRAISIVTKDSAMADFLSTSLFLMPYEDGLDLIKKVGGVEAYWIFPDGSVKFTPGMVEMLRSQGSKP